MTRIVKFPPSKNGIINDLYMDPVKHIIIEPEQCDHCHHDFVYFALFGEDGTVLEHVGGQSIKATRNRKLKKSGRNDCIQIKNIFFIADLNDEDVKAGKNPSYLFGLTSHDDGSCQRIFTDLSSTGAKMMVAQDDETIRLIPDSSSPVQKLNETNHVPVDMNMTRDRLAEEEERKLRENALNSCWNIYKWEKK